MKIYNLSKSLLLKFSKDKQFLLKRGFVLILVLCNAFFISAFQKDKSEPYFGYEQVTEQKVDSILSLLTLEEKIALLHGNGMFTSAGVARLKIPELYYTDGPFGIREELDPVNWKPLQWTNDSATFFPTGSALAATWNPEIALDYGISIGEEARTRGKDFLLGPAVNIARTPLNGRTFEYMSEDPFLNAQLAVNYIKGVQQCGVAACIKHFALNNQETNRDFVNVKVDKRTMNEIYLPAFKAAVLDAHVMGVMTAYNKVNGSYCAENDYLVNQLLKKSWGFQGVVMSDWGGTHSTIPSALSGLDVEMGTTDGTYFGLKLLNAVRAGLVPMNIIDDKVRRVLRVMLFTQRVPVNSNAQLSTPKHLHTAYEVASQSIVLLKNEKHLLPLEVNKIKRIAVIGENAIHKQATGGFGATVKTKYEITPLAGLEHFLGDKVKIEFAQGYKSTFEELDPKTKIGKPRNIADTALIRVAVEKAKMSDVAIIFVGTNHEVESESWDRNSLTLPFGQDALIQAVSATNPNTIVVVVAAAPVDLNVSVKVAPCILYAWYNGSEGGNAMADVLFGKINPSGKLPMSFPVKLEDSPAHALHAYPGDSSVAYKEGILVGYRWYETKRIKPLFSFGYGLSYSNFQFAGMHPDKPVYSKQDTIEVEVDLKNKGPLDGYETVQLYVHSYKSSVLRPEKELKAFKKVLLSSNQGAKVILKFNAAALAYYNEENDNWEVEPGKYKLEVGNSSGDYYLSSDIIVK